MIKTIWDVISLGILPIMSAPFVAAFVSKDPTSYLIVGAGTIVCEVIIKLSRCMKKIHPVLIRPKGARDCGIFNNGGDKYEGRIGMPSGHVLMTTYVFTCMYLLSSQKPEVGLLLIVGVMLMAASRVLRICHNIPQVIVGALLGFALALLTVKVVIKRARRIKTKNET